MRWQVSFVLAMVAWGAITLTAWLIQPIEEFQWLLLVLACTGFAAGLSKRGLPALPFVFGGSVLLGYFALVVGVAIWAARCPDCSDGGDLNRLGGLVLGAIFWGGITAGTLLAVGLGALLASAYQRARSVRDTQILSPPAR